MKRKPTVQRASNGVSTIINAFLIGAAITAAAVSVAKADAGYAVTASGQFNTTLCQRAANECKGTRFTGRLSIYEKPIVVTNNAHCAQAMQLCWENATEINGNRNFANRGQ